MIHLPASCVAHTCNGITLYLVCTTHNVGSHGASKNLNIIAFPTGVQAEKYLREERLCTSIIGLMGPLPNGYDSENCPVYNDHTTNCVKFTSDGALSNRCSMSLDTMKFARSSICVGLSKERQGLPLSISRSCDALVHIPHLPFCGDTSLLDTPSCLSILLSSLCEHIGFNEQDFHEHKFDVTRPTQHKTIAYEPDNNNALQSDTHNTQEVVEEDEALGYGITRDSIGDY
jgi:hypothetical protein